MPEAYDTITPFAYRSDNCLTKGVVFLEEAEWTHVVDIGELTTLGLEPASSALDRTTPLPVSRPQSGQSYGQSPIWALRRC
jgi:hypothetical protein